MWEQIINLAVKNGLWAVLFTWLLVFVIKDSTKREKKYQDTIKQLTDSLAVVEQIKDNVESIKGAIGIGKTKKKRTMATQKQSANKVKNNNFLTDSQNVQDMQNGETKNEAKI